MKPSFPIIFLTALGEQEHLARALDLEADDYLAKPFGGTELLARTLDPPPSGPCPWPPFRACLQRTVM